MGEDLITNLGTGYYDQVRRAERRPVRQGPRGAERPGVFLFLGSGAAQRDQRTSRLVEFHPVTVIKLTCYRDLSGPA